MIEFTDLLPRINESLDLADMFGTGEAKIALGVMGERNEIMESEGVVYKI